MGVKRTLLAMSLRQCRSPRRRIAKPPLVLGSSIFMSSRFDALASISAACWLIHLCDLRRMELGDCSGLIEPDLNVCAIDLNHFAVAITKYPTVRPWMKLNALAHHIGGPWLGFGCHRRAPAGMTVNIINTPRSIATPWARRPANRMSPRMSAIGPKRTFLGAPHMSAFGGKADMVIALRDVRL